MSPAYVRTIRELCMAANDQCSRRDFVLGAVLSPLVLDLAACSAEARGPSSGGPLLGKDEVLLGLYSDDEAATGADAVRAALSRVDFSWLGPGDSVLVKVASNSGNPHPATTSPGAIEGMVAELFARGAGRVVVGDQSGVQWVRATADGTTFSSTMERWSSSGILQAIQSSGAEAHPFEASGWDAYFEATPPPGSPWGAPLMLPSIVRDVDHIVYLPRLGSHAIAGYTTGHKISVGWLREDSRNHLHTACDTFYEQYTDVNYVEDIARRLRLVVTLAERMLLHFGPDTGTIHVVDPRLVIVSQHLANHELVAVSTLLQANLAVPAGSGPAYGPGTADATNRLFAFELVPALTGMPWGPGTPETYRNLVAHAFEQGAVHDRSLLRAWDILGGRPDTVRVRLDGLSPSEELRKFLVAHSGGTITISGQG